MVMEERHANDDASLAALRRELAIAFAAPVTDYHPLDAETVFARNKRREPNPLVSKRP
jgi:hypothetical protein